MDLFDAARKHDRSEPLAERMRPRTLDEIAGQDAVVGKGALLRRAVEEGRIPSLLLCGPPGTGKTTLARALATSVSAELVVLSAVMVGVPELRAAVATADEKRRLYGRTTILFVDEIHRFNKAQQDALLPHVERGTITLIGATTDNPSFAINDALLSRVRIVRLEALSEQSIIAIMRRALVDRDRGLGMRDLEATDEALAELARLADGDARRALGALELAATIAGGKGTAIDLVIARDAFGRAALRHDKKGDQHYDLASALIKSMRGSDPDAAIYYMMRMLEGGDDPLFIARRMIIFASEDVGNADPNALRVAVDADVAFQRLGMPEGIFPLAQACTYLASTVKSNASYLAWTRAQEDVQKRGALPVPDKIRNAPTKLLKEWGHGEGYRYPHDEPDGVARGETYLPDALVGARYYEPTDRGFEARIRERLASLRKR